MPSFRFGRFANKRAFIACVLAVVIALCVCVKAPVTPATGVVPVDGKLAVQLKNFAFTPSDITIRTGDKVTFSMKSVDIDHTFTVKDLGIDWPVKAGSPATQTFTFTTAGTFRFICAIPGHEGAGMAATIHVSA